VRINNDIHGNLLLIYFGKLAKSARAQLPAEVWSDLMPRVAALNQGFEIATIEMI
jgi:hypothetical protein